MTSRRPVAVEVGEAQRGLAAGVDEARPAGQQVGVVVQEQHAAVLADVAGASVTRTRTVTANSFGSLGRRGEVGAGREDGLAAR